MDSGGYLTSQSLLGSPLDSRRCSRPEQKEKEKKKKKEKGEGGRREGGERGKGKEPPGRYKRLKQKGWIPGENTEPGRWQLRTPTESQPALQLLVPHLWVRASSQAASVLSEGGDPTHTACF